MRRKANIQEAREQALEKMREARAANDIEAVEYYRGIFIALGWVQDKQGEETQLFY